MSILDRIKKLWNRLGEPDVDLPTEKEAESILKSAGLNSNNGTAKKEVVQKFNTENKPIDINEIVPQPEKSKNDEGR